MKKFNPLNRRPICILIFCLAPSIVFSQKHNSWLVPNPDFRKHLELRQAGLWNPPGTADHPLGYRPAPFTIRHNPTPAVQTGLKSRLETFPASYDLRLGNLVTPPKDQGGGATGGNCTSFATMGSLESRWLEMGLPAYDLSEQNLAACHGYEWEYGEGANQYICTAYLSRFSGPVLESQDPYNTSVFPCLDLEPVALVPEARWLPGRDFQLLKRIIYHHGAVWVSVYYQNASYRESDHTYYYSGSNPTNHAFLVCGWDDTKVTAGGTGAWIVKNSWGTSWGDNGYVYVSYSDTKFADEMAYFPVRWDTGKVDSLYLYDHLGADSTLWIYGKNQVWELAGFEAPQEQLLTRIGIASVDPNTILDIEVYDDFSDGNLSGLLARREGEIADVAGYYTFDLPARVNGDFYVKVRRIVEAEDAFIPIETFYDNYADPLIEADVNWISTDGENWASTNPGTTHSGITFPGGFNLTIRAYTSFDTGPKALFMANKTNACVGSDVIFTFLENDSVSTYAWNFGADADPVTATTAGPHTVTYASQGSKTVSLIVEGPGGRDTLVKHDYVYVADEIDVIIPDPEIRIIPGDTVEITAYGADEYVWTPSTILSSNTGQTVYATTDVEDEYQITISGSQGSCFAQALLTIISAIPPDNDNICDALLIEPVGLVGTFSNEKATKESREPAPDPLNCYTDSTWCNNEPGVVSSIWFYFYGPASGNASFRCGDSPADWDNQIAVYRADTCLQVIKDSLVGANDDQSASLLAAQLDVTVIPGAKYFLQMDGSGNSQEGSGDLYFYDYHVGIGQPRSADPPDGISVYPNPAPGVFNISLSGGSSGAIRMQVYNIKGQMIMERYLSRITEQSVSKIDLSGQPDGIYTLRLADGKRVIYRKIVKE